MMKQWLKLTSAMLTLALSAHSHSGVIVDTVYQNEYVGWWSSTSYTHNLMDGLNQTSSFTPGTAISGFLEIDVYDDNRRDCPFRFCRDYGETVLFTIEAFDFDTGGITFGDFADDLEVNALMAVNTDGMLDVTVSSLTGDFYLGNSVLTLETFSVSEPGSIALLGIGLAGLTLARRRLKA